MAQAKEITLQLSDDQLDNLRGVLNHFGWDLDSVIVNENNSSVDAETQTDTCTPGVTNDEASESNEDYEPFRIQQDQNIDECPHCFCRPCITNEVNKQQWWEDEPHPGHVRNKSLRKETFKRFWTMMFTEMCGATLAIFRKKSEHFRETIDIGTLYITVETLCQIVF